MMRRVGQAAVAVVAFLILAGELQRIEDAEAQELNAAAYGVRQ